MVSSRMPPEASKLDLRRVRVTQGDGRKQVARRHIIEQHNVGLFREHLAKLIEHIDLDFDDHSRRPFGKRRLKKGSRPPDRLGR